MIQNYYWKLFVTLKLFVVSAPEQFKNNLEDRCSPLEQVPDI